jgi:alkylated DNA nucleotide flippase Atl1
VRQRVWRVVLAAVCAAPLALRPAATAAWGMDVHRLITRRAIEGLPEPLKTFFAARIDFIAEHSTDPDLWRVVMAKSAFGEEDPNHYLHLDGYGEAAPFSGIPREWSAVVAKYGQAKADENGRLPWRAEEMYDRLVSAFHDVARGTPSYAGDNARYLVAVLAHYVEDAHVPFHATANADGQLTGQRGIHTRFETDLVLRTLKTFTLTPVRVTPIANMREFVFDTLRVSNQLVPQVLAADKQAASGRTVYDDGYFAAFAADGAKAVAEARYNAAASAVASAIVSAWQAAGKPALALEGPAAPQPIRGGRGGGR